MYFFIITIFLYFHFIFILLRLGGCHAWAAVTLGELSRLGGCRAWAAVALGELSLLGSCFALTAEKIATFQSRRMTFGDYVRDISRLFKADA